MTLKIVTYSQFYGSASNGGYSPSNASILEKLSTDENGNLTFNGKVINTNSIETAYKVVITSQHITQKYIELPNDCDSSQIIQLSLNGLVLEQGEFWDLYEKDFPEKDLIVWSGLELEDLLQLGDKVLISYYIKVEGKFNNK